ncbi:hypothetical protein ABZ805_24940 [Saccharopolyspora sp. NPDC047091]|uniref:hypothetical protein n=1 Tax=Saccharopolyspora sp. NPDC047091 TaxID=3155924 RepID=UPI0033C4E443
MIGDFVVTMRGLIIEAGDPGLREIERRAAAHGRTLPRSTLSDALAGKRLPKREVVESLVRACGKGDADVARWLAYWEAASKELLPAESGGVVSGGETVALLERYVSPAGGNSITPNRSRAESAGARDRVDPIALLPILNDASLPVRHRIRAGTKLISVAGDKRADVAAGLRLLLLDRSVGGMDLVSAARVLYSLGADYSKEACSVFRTVMSDPACDLFVRLIAAEELVCWGDHFRGEGEAFLWKVARDDGVGCLDRIYALKFIRARSAGSPGEVEVLLAGIEIGLDAGEHSREFELIEDVRTFPW